MKDRWLRYGVRVTSVCILASLPFGHNVLSDKVQSVTCSPRFIHCFSCHSWLTHHSNCLNIIHDIHNASKTKTNSGLVWCISNSPEIKATPKYFSRSLVGNLAPCSLKRASSRQCTLDMGVHDCVLVQFGWFLYSCSVHNLSYCLSVLFY